MHLAAADWASGWLGAERRDELGGGLSSAVPRGDRGASAGEQFEAEVAPSFGPFVVLFGQDGSDQASVGVAGDQRDAGQAAGFQPPVGGA